MSETKRKAPPKTTRTDYLEVNPDEKWLYTEVGKAFYDENFYRLIDFYVLHSPCKTSSYSSKSLEKLGWKNPWNSSLFRKAFDSFPGFIEDKTFFWHESKNHFRDIWNKFEEQADFFSIEKTEFAVMIYSGESNPRMDLFHHIRNAFAHGRYSVKRIDHEYYIYLEDVTSIHGLKGLFVVARICLKKTTLIDWIDFLEKKNEIAKTLSSLYS